jgi:adenylate kinase family enzyme
MPTAVRIIMLGRQGAGKGTQCRLLSEHFGAPHVQQVKCYAAQSGKTPLLGEQSKKF